MDTVTSLAVRSGLSFRFSSSRVLFHGQEPQCRGPGMVSAVGGRVEVLKDRGLGPFPAAQTAEMFHGFGSSLLKVLGSKMF